MALTLWGRASGRRDLKTIHFCCSKSVTFCYCRRRKLLQYRWSGHCSNSFKGCHVTQLPSPHTTLKTHPRGAELSTVLPTLTSVDLEIVPLLRRPGALGGFRLQLSECLTKTPSSPNPVLLELLLSHSVGTSLVVQWLRLCTPSAVGPSSIPGQGTRSHMLQLRDCMPQLKIP